MDYRSVMSRRRPILLLLASLATTMAVYWVGLSGPFLFDDAPNFEAIRPWLAGEAPLSEVLFPTGSWLHHRAFAMLTFAASAALSGYDPFGFKLGNLVVHALCGMTAYGFLARLLRSDLQFSNTARWAALAIATAWLLHPFHASTVLYAVQRMAQLSTLFCLLGMWLYVVVREKGHGSSAAQAAGLWIGVPLLMLLGIQSKQSAAALPLLCLVVEIVWLRRAGPLPPSFKLFFATFLLLPATGVAALLAFRPSALFAGYAEYDFSPYQRVISQGRVLIDYVKQLLAPHTPSMGVFTDDYVVSSSLLTPPSTLLAILALLAVTLATWHFRKRHPSLFGGWLIFLAAHSVESSFLPLELYYEHRNYLPSFGIFLAVASVAHAGAEALRGRGIRAGRVGVATMTALLIMLATMTHGRARIWADPVLLVESELRQHPKSARAVINYMGVASALGRLDRAYAVADRTIASSAAYPHLRAQVSLFRVSLDCINARGVDFADVLAAIDSLPHQVTMTSFLALDQLATHVEAGACRGVSASQMAAALARAADRATRQPDDFSLKWGMRNRAAMLYALAGEWRLAADQVRRGWQPSTPAGGASKLVEILLVSGDLKGAQRLYSEAWDKAAGQPQFRRELEQTLPWIEAERQTAGWNRRRVASP